MRMLTALRRLDEQVHQQFITAPDRLFGLVLAGLGLAYAVTGSVFWLASVLTFGYESDSELLVVLALLPWCAAPLVLVFRRWSRRRVGLLVAVGAAVQFALFMNSWGLNLAYLPLAACGILLIVMPGSYGGSRRLSARRMAEPPDSPGANRY